MFPAQLLYSLFWLILLVYAVFTSCLDVRTNLQEYDVSNILDECMEFVSFSLSNHWSYRAFQHVCVRYVQETQKLVNEEIPLQKPSYYSVMDTMHMDDTVRSHLEVTPRSIFKLQFQCNQCLELPMRLCLVFVWIEAIIGSSGSLTHVRVNIWLSQLLKTSRWGKVEGSVVWALDDTQTAMGGRLLRRWLLWPLIDYDQICTRQDAVEVTFLSYSHLLYFALGNVACQEVAGFVSWDWWPNNGDTLLQLRHLHLLLWAEN